MYVQSHGTDPSLASLRLIGGGRPPRMGLYVCIYTCLIASSPGTPNLCITLKESGSGLGTRLHASYIYSKGMYVWFAVPCNTLPLNNYSWNWESWGNNSDLHILYNYTQPRVISQAFSGYTWLQTATVHTRALINFFKFFLKTQCIF